MSKCVKGKKTTGQSTAVAHTEHQGIKGHKITIMK